MVSSDVLIAGIAALGGIATTYLTVKYRNQYVLNKKPVQSKDRMDTIFDGYENLIKQQQSDIDRKSKLIDHLQEIVDKQREEIARSQDMIDTLRDELADSQKRTKALEYQLSTMKEDYQKQNLTAIDTP